MLTLKLFYALIFTAVVERVYVKCAITTLSAISVVGVKVFSVRSPGAVGIEQHGQLSETRDDGWLVCKRLIHILIGQVIMNVVDTGFVCLLLRVMLPGLLIR